MSKWEAAASTQTCELQERVLARIFVQTSAFKASVATCNKILNRSATFFQAYYAPPVL